MGGQGSGRRKGTGKGTGKGDWKRGPEQEKHQLTIRIDKELDAQMEALCARMGLRITDLIERGIVLALKEHKALAALPARVRFLTTNLTKARQAALERFLSFLVMEELFEPTPLHYEVREFVFRFLEMFQPYSRETIEIYSRYGRSDDELT